jgi:tetratricopeptide (TPR) repeat protein
MKNFASFFVTFIITCILATSCAVLPQSSNVYRGNANLQSVEGGVAFNKKFEATLKKTYVYNPGAKFYSIPNEVSVSDNEFKVSHKSKTIVTSIPDIQDVNVLDWSSHNNLGTTGHYRYSMELQKTVFSWDNLKTAQDFADAIAYLKNKRQMKISKESFEAFEPIAAQYRALKVKPPVSEEQRKYIVQANSMTQLKNYAEAINLYDKAIEADQTNPIVYYNQALLLAQVKRFDVAINRMKKYLLLSPGASDARSAQDKIYEWEILMQK